MLNWLTGARITDVAEDLNHMPHGEPDDVSRFEEPPETPAPVFAVRAFKQAIFGTPAPQMPTRPAPRERRPSIQEQRRPMPAEARPVLEPPNGREPFSDNAPSSPTKPGILMTPGTQSKNRKQVSFGAQVVDNEGKRGRVTRVGSSNEIPGKFPSPFTPKVEDVPEPRTRTRLTAALLDARESVRGKPKPKARDDADITLDVMEPRSESGRYWKAEYESYAENSEKEIKKLVMKQRITKDFAQAKDEEKTQVTLKLEAEYKRHQEKEKQWELQMQDMKEKLRQAMAENAKTSMESAVLKRQLEGLKHELESKNATSDKVVVDTVEPVRMEKRQSIDEEELSRPMSFGNTTRLAIAQFGEPENLPSFSHAPATAKVLPRRRSHRERTLSANDSSADHVPSELLFDGLLNGGSKQEPKHSTPRSRSHTHTLASGLAIKDLLNTVPAHPQKNTTNVAPKTSTFLEVPKIKVEPKKSRDRANRGASVGNGTIKTATRTPTRELQSGRTRRPSGEASFGSSTVLQDRDANSPKAPLNVAYVEDAMPTTDKASRGLQKNSQDSIARHARTTSTHETRKLQPDANEGDNYKRGRSPRHEVHTRNQCEENMHPGFVQNFPGNPVRTRSIATRYQVENVDLPDDRRAAAAERLRIRRAAQEKKIGSSGP
ncbi:hypothetical protein K402DRAFT_465996 [Aulographum hederae CBS 113979]|uniref:Spindle pole body-associated protein cut12 domain-containing protein n=1 Tax=Aulographum hederae CBS 113979 TaxID=1176131 RepID=A0A6G1GRM4_9PEZI|nr:hypothetical protein K402DRAFT_465996 [Aulographum hederae CBS 113979]